MFSGNEEESEEDVFSNDVHVGTSHGTYCSYQNVFVIVFIMLNVNVNVHVYSPGIPVGSADCTIYTPGIGTHSFTVSSPLGRIQHLRPSLQL